MENNGNGQVFPFERPKVRRRRWKWVRWLVAVGLVLLVIGLILGKTPWVGFATLIVAGIIATGMLGD